jgi:hypothetical protein
MGRARDIANIINSGTFITPASASATYLSQTSASTIYAPASSTGLVLINATSFSAQSSANINNVFSSTYESYRIIVEATAANNANVFFRFRSGTTDLSTGYYGGGLLYQTNGSLTSSGARNNGTEIMIQQSTHQRIYINSASPSTPQNGQIWINTSTASAPIIQSYGSGQFRTPRLNRTKADGGVITYSGVYTIHTFNSLGTFTLYENTSVDYLVIAGGGGGGKGFQAGGGGAGGYLSSNISLSASAYVITVGSGGNGGSGGSGNTPLTQDGSNGTNSSFASVNSIGGGGGTSYWSGSNGKNGGSGGGAGATGSSRIGGIATVGQGNNGGASTTYTTPYCGGGGGGAGGAGSIGGNSIGNGGNGLINSISGSSLYYAGGGGGAPFEGSSVGTGGLGGGGNASISSTAQNGTINTGGGGGGGGLDGISGGAGGSGIVIIRYLT